MGKYFGTDGVRGEANKGLTPELAFRLGRLGGYVLSQHENGKPKVYVARDTRISGQMLITSLISGLLSVGIEVYNLGILATPGLAYLVKKDGASAGVMVTASHNPAPDNGIKFFGGDGFKLEDAQELEIEALLDAQKDELPRPSAEGLGRLFEYEEAKHKYAAFLIESAQGNLSNLTVVLDTANGATSTTARTVFMDLEANTEVIGDVPNGLNINDQIGSTHPELLVKKVLSAKADIGLAFDGDGDRLIAVDELGTIVDGDKIMYIIAKFLKSKNKLAKNTVATTVMSNLGFHQALERAGIQTTVTAVGDRYVLEALRKKGLNFGGEQSGHMIFLDESPTGDGQLSAVHLTRIMQETGKKLSELASEIEIFPQKLVNIRLKKIEDGAHWEANAAIKAIVDEKTAALGNDGRILVRASGTEPLLRIMAEAPTQEEVEEVVSAIASVVQDEFGV